MTISLPRPLEDDEIVYHYTDAGGLIGMITSGRLWATERGAQNDPSEDSFGEEVLRSFHPEVRKVSAPLGDLLERPEHRPITYLTCATLADDDVSQWSRYTHWPDVGYAIGLRVGSDMHAVGRSATPVSGPIIDEGSNTRCWPWTPVLYGEDQLLAVARANLDEWTGLLQHSRGQTRRYAALSMRAILESLAITSKRAGYATEREVRLVARDSGPQRFKIENPNAPVRTATPGESAHVRFRPTRYGVARYLELVDTPEAVYAPGTSFSRSHTRGAVFLPPGHYLPLPIASITVSPSPYSSGEVEAVEALLLAHGYSDVELKVSTNRLR